MHRKQFRLSRRDFLTQAFMAGAVFPSNSRFLPLGSSNPQGISPTNNPLIVHIQATAPAGPPPLGPPVETSIPFRHGQVFHPENLSIFSPRGQPVMMQAKSSATWPDGSIRWLSVVFEASDGPGDYTLKLGKRPASPELVYAANGKLLLNTGEVELAFIDTPGGWLESVSGVGKDGHMHPLIQGPGCADLRLIRPDGKTFLATLAAETGTMTIEERGPIRASVRCQGKLRAKDGSQLFDFIFRWTAYRARPEVYLTVSWINNSEASVEKVRDLRLIFPFVFSPERLVFSCDRGVYDGPYLKDWPVYLLQEDYDCYWAKTVNPDGRIQNLSSGGCNGEQAPGWLYFQSARQCLGIWVPNFHEEYPNEISLREGELSVGLWPERASRHLASKPILPADPFGNRPYEYAKYWPVMPHPYLAFFDAEEQCLAARQGMAKTQDIVLSLWAGKEGMPAFERKWWNKTLQPVRGQLDPAYVSDTGALGILSPRDAKIFPHFEQLFDENFQWLDRHIDVLRCYGKFDYGDFKYMTAGTDYMCHPGTKWGEMGEMAREGYWHNNERDPLLGLLLYYFRTGNPKVWDRCRIVARHLFDIDICHHPRWGMWTHSYGHCYLAQGKAGEPDHSWLLGMMHWAAISGDPILEEWITRCGEDLRNVPIDFAEADARTVSVYLHIMCQFYLFTSRAEYLDAAQGPVQVLLKFQKANGSWPAYLGNPNQSIEGFVEHVVMALADYYAIRRDEIVLRALNQAVDFLFGKEGEKPVDVGESSLALYALAVLGDTTGSPHYTDLVSVVLEKLHAQLNLSQDPLGRGDPWAQWGINNPEVAKTSGRPKQFLGQTRPLSPASTLAYGQPALALLARRKGSKE